MQDLIDAPLAYVGIILSVAALVLVLIARRMGKGR
jgi:hypothetical protein